MQRLITLSKANLDQIILSNQRKELDEDPFSMDEKREESLDMLSDMLDDEQFNKRKNKNFDDDDLLMGNKQINELRNSRDLDKFDIVSEGLRSEKLGSNFLEARSDASFKENNLLKDINDNGYFVQD